MFDGNEKLAKELIKYKGKPKPGTPNNYETIKQRF